MEFRLLGALEVWSGPEQLPLRGSRERKVLALLLLQANRTVSIPHLVDALWDEDPPATADKQVRNAVSRLRAVLAAGPGRTGDITAVGDAGYRLTVPEGALDAAEFERDVGAAERAAAAGDVARAAARLRTALDRWRGPALAGISGRILEAGAAAWNERRLAVQETWTDHQLALGRHAHIVADLSATVAEHPLREKPVRQLMLALHRSGRHSDALDAYHALRTRLGEELGLDAGPELRRLHQQILNHDAAVAAPQETAAPAGPAATTVPRQLPSAVRQFTGRRRHLKVLDETLDRSSHGTGGAAGSSGTAVICAIGGTAGIGKSALALHWAQRHAERFPDGQLHVNLRGFAPGARPLTPSEALRGFLQALGVPADRVPQEPDAQTALYRSLVSGRRMLVVLDNARDADQVRPLLPGTPTCMVLVTSRNQLAGLVAAEGAVPVTLGLLSAAESLDLLTRRLGPERTAAEPEAAARLVELCARLPLALSIAAARALVTPGMSLAGLVGALLDVRDRLDTLDTGDATTDLRAVFSWSYEHLGPDSARMFRLLAVHPGPDISDPAAAGLAGMPLAAARRSLNELTRANLLVEHVPGRFTCHDLLRAYAAELAAVHDDRAARQAAVGRVLDHYLHTAARAQRLLSQGRTPFEPGPPLPGTTPEPLAGPQEAGRWMEREGQVILAVLTLGDEYGLDAQTGRLAWLMMSFIDRRRHAGPDAGTGPDAEPGPDAGSEPDAGPGTGPGRRTRIHRGLGPNYSWMVDYPAALGNLRHFAEVYRGLGDSTGLAHVEFGIACVLEHQERYAEALEHARRSMEMFSRVGHRSALARATNAVGWLLTRTGRCGPGLTYGRRALALYRELDDRSMEAVTWDNVGCAEHGLGRYDEAAASFERSLALTRDLGDPHAEAITLGHLADAHRAAGRGTEAAGARRAALAVLAGTDDKDAEALRGPVGP